MGTEGISFATTMFTIGGLVSCLIAGSSTVSSWIGRKAICILNSAFYVIGSLMMTFANNLWQLYSGRLLCGMAAGLSLVITPILINEITPINHRGLLGSCLQVSIGIGILSSQAIALPYANSQQWRNIFLTGTLMGLIQFVTLFTIVESPKWIVINTGDISSATSILHDLRSNKGKVSKEINHWRRLSMNMDADRDVSTTEETPLINSNPFFRVPKRRTSSTGSCHMSIIEFLTISRCKKELRAVFILMSALQLCGINAITFYGVSVLSNMLEKGTNLILVSCAISTASVVAGTLVSPLVDRLGRKLLLLISIFTMGISSFLVSLSSVYELDALSAAAVFIFVTGYAIGLGPVPYLMIPELAAFEFVGAAQSFGSAVNWTSNIILAFFFPILNSYLKNHVFYVFFVISMVYFVAVLYYVPETHRPKKKDAVIEE